MTRRLARWIAVAAAAAAPLALPAAAGATLAYVKAPLNPAVYAAADNGSGAHRLGPGTNPRVSPDGESVAYLREGPGGAQELKLAPAAGRRLADADDRLARILLPRLLARLEDDRGAARAGNRQAASWS